MAFCRTRACLTNLYVPLRETESTLEEMGLTHRKLPKNAFLPHDRGSHHLKQVSGGFANDGAAGIASALELKLLMHLLGLSSCCFWLRTFCLPGFLTGPKMAVQTFLSLWAQFYFAKYSFKSPRKKPQLKPRSRINHLPFPGGAKY